MDFGNVIAVLVIIFVSMTLHELMHGIVAHRLGDDTARLMGRLTLNPFRHIDPIMTIALPVMIIFTNALTGAAMPVFGGAKPVPFNPENLKYGEWGIAMVAASGPLVNLLLAFISYAIAAYVGDGNAVGKLLATSVAVNLGFFAFNIIPIPPLDGSRVFYVIAPDFIRRFFEVAEQYGIVLVYIAVLVLSPVLTVYMQAVIYGCASLFSLVI
ncbi:site-2 protease family protein [Candidatus Southlakia epibionticum]|uniref:Site-2 protease family protein n=1 Tax=Candidatus Southlakia epibionticum TaxID=3043284 RepID=A0ABY8WVN3_9BACT|nr:site-2 protease family protein [Candidatus Saccharimonadaceae bacterium ML1]